ncbi:1-(5-phosphoribosyl)-5-[(5-phosphoribosylamino)methylideneamino]imidazole-4-carboxamide isomerase [Acetobacter orleanensis]|uniref:1-(5-phosphoribosyl)-5-[(5-phosphoribosylamino)methylideneamino] imidazole-4-carboxamide isomerase n=1 Tax=Acetobacter orleanensis TaxID=104099 RepID=A0A4Y3TNK9_9PROT|nr:1-(5-phosphoribosyl)-5-[(5-phosphoribosylamino)methylideneamino]imidazole-4-carboxamide isomerase [Acetobacter orleanensis]KXV62350.1 1-(5-phosphoribosyl)-5-[(5-phosphoribosylamino)methylideneamino] imidazole-4-carboxamide isomerase [Acetobacter orleanensis]PCD79432.1 1-(5-phosphoribosyl)-5-[(5-phosphoribosylamino)methylideneamino]imidazole-4-carboxamide isomerase [Acetobacter orleanensis]GAN67580.1 histidine biosynthesis isomerase HisA [Acetobacter orleanensis JCM 7639]GBR25402.1 fusion pro
MSVSKNKFVQRALSLTDDDLQALCEAADAAILDGGGFGWVQPQGRQVLERYFRGLLLVPERMLFVVRLKGEIVGCAQLVRPPRNNECQAMCITLMHLFVAPYARNRGLGGALLHEVENAARSMGFRVMNMDVPDTQTAAISLFQKAGFLHWGTHPHFARMGDQTVSGLFFTKLLDTVRSAPAEPSFSSQVETPDMIAPTASSRPLTLYPAIDLKDGACVRLRRGEMDDATVYSDDPAAQARAWCDAGFKWLHAVDLNGAFAGQSANAPAVRAILEASTVPMQLGGGLRDMKAIASWLEAGVTRVILGSVAVKNPALVKEACRAFPGRIVAGIDARSGHVATEGWAEVSDMQATELALRMQDAGVAAIIFTEISRDGMLDGLDIDQTVTLANTVSVPVIASGGVGNLDHLAALRKAADDTPGIEGVIVGRALYDGRVSPAEALKVLA